MTDPVISPKKLIEVALPLDAINVASAKEKSIRQGHPSTLHLWWARRPLAAARAVIFAQLVHDPEDLWRCQNPGQEPNQQVRGHWTKARAKLFKIIEDLVIWENTTNEAVLKPAREAIRQSWRETCELNKEHSQAKELFDPAKMPGLHDPFAGGGAIPLEAQRLGLEAFASDLNPVAVLINKAMIEIPPKFSGRPPVHPNGTNPLMTWSGAAGLAEDVRYYGAWLRAEALKRIGHLYLPIEITKAMVNDRSDLKQYEGEKLTVIAWLWARTVKSPNPAFSKVDVPLASTFILSSKEGKETFVQPVIGKGSYHFTVKVGSPTAEAKAGTKSARGANFRCLLSDSPIEPAYIKAEAMAGRMGQKLMAIVAEGTKGRVFLSPTVTQEQLAFSVDAKEAAVQIHVPLANDPRNLWCLKYGLDHFDMLFTARQLFALTTLSDLVGEATTRIRLDADKAGLGDDDRGIEDGGNGPRAYSEAVSIYLGIGVSRTTNTINNLAMWSQSREQSVNLFSRQAIPMAWDFPEVNPFGNAAGDYITTMESMAKTIVAIAQSGPKATVTQANAQSDLNSHCCFISTDPPYYDNIGYADLSDFFYVWIRRSLRSVLPRLLATIAVPKAEELVATPYRHGTKEKAEKFFLDGMTQAMRRLATQSHPAAPITIYYAFKQSETETEGTNSTGWETFLDAVLKSGLSIGGTWPMRTERPTGVKVSTNALASSIILVCRPRTKDAGSISRRQFVRMLNEALPLALDAMTRESEGLHSPVAPVDLSQAIIGPGMAIFSRYDAVLEADGTPMTVRTALQLINRFLAEDDFDADTQFCLHWFEQHAWETAKFGEADTLARAKGTSVAGVQQSGVIEAGGGNVRLLKWRDYPADWDAASDSRLPVWEALHQLIRAYNSDGDSGAAVVLAGVAGKAEAARQLAYRLYTLCERAGRAEDARAYNEVVTGWSGIESAAVKVATPLQRKLFDYEEAS